MQRQPVMELRGSGFGSALNDETERFSAKTAAERCVFFLTAL